MKSQIFFAVAALFLLTVRTYASKSKEQDLRDALFSAMFSADNQLNPQERECRYWLGTCSKTGDCCSHLSCSPKHGWCVWDWTFRK
uniref:U5-theraphotoxin-Hhn1a n=1 Tax=Cyriopagopus hainanus TaxID=2781057 RepID=H7A01_CYRHA|nr:RecName: Full=U5-theraphotoxin-Hhn1a; Short=U5-TRTX-Hhn1a; AltName: Full=Hainantoxin-VII; Short=HNTX-VII; AltName: Full=Peptide F4-32.71; Flags: Precursor [Haplopelma hainanum]ADB56816.1 HNTX-VII precursor [Haplopelma hainanum]